MPSTPTFTYLTAKSAWANMVFHTLILGGKSFNHLTVLESDIIVSKIRLHFNKFYDCLFKTLS